MKITVEVILKIYAAQDHLQPNNKCTQTKIHFKLLKKIYLKFRSEKKKLHNFTTQYLYLF